MDVADEGLLRIASIQARGRILHPGLKRVIHEIRCKARNKSEAPGQRSPFSLGPMALTKARPVPAG